MKAALFAAVALAATAGSAMADVNAHIIGYTPITDEVTASTRASNTVVFSAMTGPYQGFAAAGGALGFDDYVSTLGPGNSYLQSFRFAGGVVAAGGTIQVQFYNTSATLINAFNITLPSAGNFLWNIGLESVAGAKDSTFLIPNAGYVEIDALGAATGQWFLSTTLPSVGSSSLTLGDTTTHTHNFELTVPAPGSLALLGFGGILAARRRR